MTDHFQLAEGATLLRGFAIDEVQQLLAAVDRIAVEAPFRYLTTRGGYQMSVAMTNTGRFGWVSDRNGYRYDPIDPDSRKPWPPMPAEFLDLAQRAAAAGGFENYNPDVCLINRYVPGSKLGMHQDRDEQDSWSPIVSVSLGIPATFIWGSLKRAGRPARIRVESGDVVVWGGASRMVYHGVAPLPEGEHPLTGRSRINLTFRKVL
jgi:alkylated DNA repair protein (DNA oxidative demethylase)